ncbi:MAG: flagellar basal-body rod protein FlgG [Thermoleophilaceae bacterium]
MDALSNDVANANTSGYKHVRVGFRDLVYQPDGNAGVSTGAGAAATQVGRGFQEGSLRQTDQPFDMAIQGPGYFQVRTADGQTRLSRDGSFAVDATGTLVNSNGDRLVPPIRIPRDTNPATISITANGTVTTAGRRIGQVTLVTVASPTGLASVGNSLYAPTAASGPVRPATGVSIQQRALETSDVNLADSMVDIMDSQRSYAMTSKAIQMQDQMMQIANGVKQ